MTAALDGVIVIVLARAGSKGVPGKNVAPIAGRPCLAWTIEHARRTPGVSRVIVSTDDPLAARIARESACTLRERPAELASDTATIDAAARDAIGELAPNAPPHQPVAILYANVPVRPADLLARATGRLVTSGCDSVQSYQRVGKYHPWWTARLDATGNVTPWEGDVLNHGVYRRQDLPPAYIPDGGVIVCTRRALMLEIPGVAPGPHAFFGRDRRGVENPPGSVIDIDEPLDLLVADALLRGAGR